jgi:hypothetical protein
VFSFAEEIKAMGLDVPPLVELVQELRKRGKSVAKGFLTAEETAAEILSGLSGRNKL